MTQENLLEALRDRPLCCDGAMGTQLMAHGLASGACGMIWNEENPEVVRAIHAAYRAAGCELLTTNSFGGTVFALERHGAGGRMAALNRAAAELARSVAGPDAWVLGDVGPFGGFLEPLGDTTPEELLAAFCAQIEALLAGGADAVLIETMSDAEEAAIAVQAARACNPQVPVLATFAFQKGSDGGFRTMMGTTVTDALARVLDAGAQVVGANCGTSLNLDDYVVLTQELVAAASGVPVMVQPNAGSPRVDAQGRTVYDAAPDHMARCAARLLEAGARVVGGCCGTTPAHVAMMAQVVRATR